MHINIMQILRQKDSRDLIRQLEEKSKDSNPLLSEYQSLLFLVSTIIIFEGVPCIKNFNRKSIISRARPL